MKHPHLPQYFAIKRDENNPLWFEFVEWINKIQPLRFVTWEYIGIDKNGCQGSDVFDNFRPNPVTLITLSEWKNAIDKTEDMKETEFKPGEYCRFSKEEIASMIDLLRENGHNINDSLVGILSPEVILFDGDHFPSYMSVVRPENYYTELTREQFMFKATRGKGTIKESLIVQTEFDPSKPFEVSFNMLHEITNDWESGDGWNFIGYGIDKLPIMQHDDRRVLSAYGIRNIEPFHAGMLEAGEKMIVETLGLKCTNHHVVATDQGAVIDIETGREITCNLSTVKGRRVKVNITTEEI